MLMIIIFMDIHPVDVVVGQKKGKKKSVEVLITPNGSVGNIASTTV